MASAIREWMAAHEKYTKAAEAENAGETPELDEAWKEVIDDMLCDRLYEELKRSMDSLDRIMLGLARRMF